jgi:uncharacterized protein
LSRCAWTEEPEGIRLFVRVTPRAKRSMLVGIIEDGEEQARLSIKLAAPPVDGAANKALVAFLAEALGVARSAVEIVSGETSRLKAVRIRGVTAAMAAANFPACP